MKHFFLSLLILLVSISGSQLYAETGSLSREDAFIFFASQQKQVPESFQYIQLEIQGVKKDSLLEDSLQKLIYTDSIKNTQNRFFPKQNISQYEFYTLANAILKLSVPNLGDMSQKIPATRSDIDIVKALGVKNPSGTVSIQITGNGNASLGGNLSKKQKILLDVYETLETEHYNSENFTEELLINGAIKGLTQETGDKYTTYFPPVESTDFFESLEGEFEGIGAYVEMPSPGKLIIISPIVGSPAEASGIQGADKITHIDGKEITEKNTLGEVVSWIKGPAGTTVKLTIIREGVSNPIEITVTRARIIVKDIEYKRLNTSTFYIQLKSFGDKSSEEFTQALEELKQYPQMKKLIIDVRNNPGGYLMEVSDILSHFIPQGEATAQVSTASKNSAYISHGYSIIDTSTYQIVILQNGGSASASEILSGTLKDYFPNTYIIGEKSFGKGSVQSLKSYYDGSTLKYTSAKWFTGKTRKAIDGIGVIPDKVLEFDTKLFETSKIDNQLQAALDY